MDVVDILDCIMELVQLPASALGSQRRKTTIQIRFAMAVTLSNPANTLVSIRILEGKAFRHIINHFLGGVGGTAIESKFDLLKPRVDENLPHLLLFECMSYMLHREERPLSAVLTQVNGEGILWFVYPIRIL